MINRFTATLLFALSSLSHGVYASAQASAADSPAFNTPDEAWRDVDPENLVLIDTAYGMIGVELYPEIAPKHTQRIKALARSKFYDDVPFHRVIEGFMNQTGDGSNGNGTGDSDLPNLEAKFTFRRSDDMVMAPLGKRYYEDKQIEVGFYKGLPIASKPISQAFLTKDGKVEAFGLHCKGVTSMARANDPNSANSQFFLMRDKSESLDKNYSIWGATVMGRKYVEKPKVGDVSQDPNFVPDRMQTVRIAADLPEDERPKVQVMKTDGSLFRRYLDLTRKRSGKYPDICDINVPTRTL